MGCHQLSQDTTRFTSSRCPSRGRTSQDFSPCGLRGRGSVRRSACRAASAGAARRKSACARYSFAAAASICSIAATSITRLKTPRAIRCNEHALTELAATFLASPDFHASRPRSVCAGGRSPARRTTRGSEETESRRSIRLQPTSRCVQLLIGLPALACVAAGSRTPGRHPAKAERGRSDSSARLPSARFRCWSRQRRLMPRNGWRRESAARRAGSVSVQARTAFPAAASAGRGNTRERRSSGVSTSMTAKLFRRTSVAAVRLLCLHQG